MPRCDKTTPCNNCPFRNDIPSYLRADRVREIEMSLILLDASFSCHKTTVPSDDEDGTMVDGPKAQHCAGAMILLAKMGRPNQAMRIAERLGKSLDLDLSAPVFDSFDDMRRAQRDYDEEEEMSFEPCNVAEYGCEAPAGYMGSGGGVVSGTVSAEFYCYGCGDAVCGSCSREHEGERLCIYCHEQETGEE